MSIHVHERILGERHSFSKVKEVMAMPYLLETQKQSYRDFLQAESAPDQRDKQKGLQEAFCSIFPIQTPGNPTTLEFVEYSLGTPKYDVRECLARGMTYAAPLKVKLQLIVREADPETNVVEIRDIKEQETYMGDIPLMTEQGTFIINGAERVVVSQLHRSPGISFSSAVHQNGKNTYSARVIPYRGAWVEFEVDIYNVMHVIIDRKRKIPATTFLRAFGMETDEEIARAFFEFETIALDDFSLGATSIDALEQYIGEEFIEDAVDEKIGKRIVEKGAKVTKKSIDALKASKINSVQLTVAESYKHVLGRILAQDVIDKKTGEILGEAFERVTTTFLRRCAQAKINRIEVIVVANEESNVLLSTIDKDKTKCYDEAVIEIFKRLRPGNPVSVSSGRRLIEDTFFNEKRYDLGMVGRYKINNRFRQDAQTESRLLDLTDIIAVVRHLVELHAEREDVDDIDHLGNRRVRCVGELLQNQIRVGLAEMEKTARDRMSVVELENMLPHNLINAKPVATAIKDFFGRSQLSQFMDQTNPLAELTHKRRLSALGPGGLSRDRAGFEVRDVHHTHYGRICPIETPEGPNIGLISSLCTYARINPYGFIETPYRRVKNGKVTDEIEYLTADVEDRYAIAQASTPLAEDGRFKTNRILARQRADYPRLDPKEVDYMDVAPKQLVSVSAAIIPFLEHDDANRALMGSNMQRQAVPLMFTEAPLVGTGVERQVAMDSGACVIATADGEVVYVASNEIHVRESHGNVHRYPLEKYKRSNQNTCINQTPIVSSGQKVRKGDVLADGPACDHGELALGRNILVAFMPWGGYNFEDAILLSEELVRNDTFTSIHIEEFEIEARDTKLGKEEITRDIPNVSEEALMKLDEEGMVYIGAEVAPGDILVGKVTPKGETELSSEEKLLRAIFGEKAGDVRDASLKVPPGTEGIVVDIKVFTRKERASRTDKIDKQKIDEIEKQRAAEISQLQSKFKDDLTRLLGEVDRDVINYETGKVEIHPGAKVTEKNVDYVERCLRTGMLPVDGRTGVKIKKLYQDMSNREQAIHDHAKNQIDRIKTGDELPPGVIKLVKVYIAKKRKLSVGDKMAGRHGNKGVIAKILPIEDMPYMADGTPIQIVLNPLGVPSRMNVGQVLETHLGWAAKALGLRFSTPVFDGANEEQVFDLLEKGGLPRTGQSTLYDGLTGEAFDTPVTVGYMYVMKLAHLVDDKMHARAIGPYSLVTQQPLGGKAQFGGQRFGEMEVWALEAYGAAYTLQELLTVKSDDVTGRTKIYESIVKGHNPQKPGIPESFNVLVKELQSLCLNLELLTEEEIVTEEEKKEEGGLAEFMEDVEQVDALDEAFEKEEEEFFAESDEDEDKDLAESSGEDAEEE